MVCRAGSPPATLLMWAEHPNHCREKAYCYYKDYIFAGRRAGTTTTRLWRDCSTQLTSGGVCLPALDLQQVFPCPPWMTITPVASTDFVLDQRNMLIWAFVPFRCSPGLLPSREEMVSALAEDLPGAQQERMQNLL